MAELTDTDTDIRERVRERYAAAATAVAESTGSGCCGAPAAIAGCGPDIASTDKDGNEVFGVALYDEEGDAAPRAAVEASLGCGSPHRRGRPPRGRDGPRSRLGRRRRRAASPPAASARAAGRSGST